MTQLPGLFIQEEEIKGRAVFTSQDISKGDLIELCPVITLSADDTLTIHDTKLHDYYFVWQLDENTSAIALGYGSLYNHSENANADFETDHSNKVIRITALRDISAFEEINLDYTSGLKTEHGLWFKAQ